MLTAAALALLAVCFPKARGRSLIALQRLGIGARRVLGMCRR